MEDTAPSPLKQSKFISKAGEGSWNRKDFIVQRQTAEEGPRGPRNRF